MSCVPCKVLMLEVAKVLESLGKEELSPEARAEVRKLKIKMMLTAYYIEDQALREAAKERKRGKVCDCT